MEERAAEVERSQGVPARALLFSILALAVPVLALVFWPDQVSQDQGLLVWLMALIPPFLLTYHRGWLGASLALIVGMTVLVGANLLIVLTGRPTPEPSFMVWLTGTYVFVCVGAGALSEVPGSQRSNQGWVPPRSSWLRRIAHSTRPRSRDVIDAALCPGSSTTGGWRPVFPIG